MHGLKHVFVHYLGTPPTPEAIKLYDAFNNRECLHCHEGARSFEEGAVHTAQQCLGARLHHGREVARLHQGGSDVGVHSTK